MTVAYAARVKDEKIIMESSSGGIFSAFSDYILENEGAIACTLYNYEKNIPEFQLVTNYEKRDKARGSKYIQSYMGDIFQDARKWLFNNPTRKLMFIGTGCQVAGFKSYMKREKVDDRILYVDLICHGVPSPLIWQDYVSEIEKNGESVSYVDFKDKRNGWHNPFAYARVKEKEIFLESFTALFYKQLSIRPSCYKCPYTKVVRETDITIGDYWGIESVLDNIDVNYGISLALLHSEKGMKLFENIKSKIDFYETDLKSCLQPRLISPAKMPINRKKFWKSYREKGINYSFEKYGRTTICDCMKNKIYRIVNRSKGVIKKMLSCSFGR